MNPETAQIRLPDARLSVRRWPVVAKLVLVLGGLGLLLHWSVEALPDQGAAPLRLSPWALVVGAVMNQAALLAAALRLRGTLAVFGVRLTPGQALSIHLRSLFYFFFVPFSVGLELARYLHIRRLDAQVSGRTLLFALLLDRVLGLIAAVGALVGFAVFVVPASLWVRLDALWLLAGGLLVTIAGAGALLHRGLRANLVTLARAMRTFSFRLIWPILLSFAALALVCGSVYVVAAASAWDVGPGQVAFALSASLLGMAVPVSLFGATLGEATGVGVLALLGITPAVAILLVTLAYTWRLFSAMQGALLELLDGVRQSRRPA